MKSLLAAVFSFAALDISLAAALENASVNTSNLVAQMVVSPEREASLLKEVKVPDGFAASIFAVPPAVNYPVFVAAAPDGVLYVSSDKNGSLDRGPGRGRVLRVKDTDGDGHGDEVKQFVANVDSPRGLVWDRDRLYLLHPPHLSAYIDHDGDGIAEEERVLVKNIAFGFKDRPADHSSNGIELGVDGWIYCAIGDFGFMEAEGTDGRKQQLRGGGVVRVRPDGTEMELYSRGTRNILEVAVSPTLDMFARDNTNDGDGWDIRLHHFTPLSDHGYPSLFKHFPGDYVPPLADYGGGSGCGAMFLSEPGFPEGYNNAVYTADWGREWVYRHHPTPKGATFSVDQSEFARAPRVTDLDVDGSSRIYVASWKGASFTYVGEDVGFIVQTRPKGYTAPALPDFAKLSKSELAGLFKDASHRRRLAAQRELLTRPLSTSDTEGLKQLAAGGEMPIETRVIALWTLKQYLGEAANEFLASLIRDANSVIRAHAIRAMLDRETQLSGMDSQAALALLEDKEPAVRREAVFAVARLNKSGDGTAVAAILGDSDPIVAHTAVQSLRKMRDAPAAFAVIDNSSASSIQKENAFRVLQALHDGNVVEGLVKRLDQAPDDVRKGILTCLARLYHKEGPWKGDSWGTRPDTTGPYYQPEEWESSPEILKALTDALETASSDDAEFLARELARHKVQTPATLATLLRMAETNERIAESTLTQLARTSEVPQNALSFLVKAAGSANASEISRANAVIALSRLRGEDAARAMLNSLPELQGGGREAGQARQSFLRWRNASDQHAFFEKEAARLDGKSSIWAEAALLHLSESKSATPEARAAASKSLEEGWNSEARKLQILEAVALSEHRSSKDRVLSALDDANPQIAKAAEKVARALRLKREPKPTNEPQIGSLQVADVVAKVQSLHGSRKAGEELFTRQGCVACHTVSTDQPLRGPYLGNIASIYKRDELASAILVPGKTIAQGFATHFFELRDGTELEGFVVQEAADKVQIRTIAAQEISISTADVVKRAKLEKSLMPEGLAANMTVKELASLLDYLEGLNETAGGNSK